MTGPSADAVQPRNQKEMMDRDNQPDISPTWKIAGTLNITVVSEAGERCASKIACRPGATLSFHTAVDCHWLPFLRDSHSILLPLLSFSAERTASPRASTWRASHHPTLAATARHAVTSRATASWGTSHAVAIFDSLSLKTRGQKSRVERGRS